MNLCRRERLVVVKINLLVLARALKPLDKDVVVHPPASVHAHLDPFVFQKTCESHVRELRALVRVENLRIRDPECFPQRLRVQGRGKLLGDEIPAVPVHDRREINESMSKKDLSYIVRARRIGLIDRNSLFHAYRQHP